MEYIKKISPTQSRYIWEEEMESVLYLIPQNFDILYYDLDSNAGDEMEEKNTVSGGKGKSIDTMQIEQINNMITNHSNETLNYIQNTPNYIQNTPKKTSHSFGLCIAILSIIILFFLKSGRR